MKTYSEVKLLLNVIMKDSFAQKLWPKNDLLSSENEGLLNVLTKALARDYWNVLSDYLWKPSKLRNWVRGPFIPQLAWIESSHFSFKKNSRDKCLWFMDEPQSTESGNIKNGHIFSTWLGGHTQSHWHKYIQFFTLQSQMLCITSMQIISSMGVPNSIIRNWNVWNTP